LSITDREPIFTNNAPAGEEWFPRLLAQAATGFNFAMRIITGLLVLTAAWVACGQEGIPVVTPAAQVMPTVEPLPEAPPDVAPTSPPPPAISEAMVAPISLAIPDLVVERSFANLTFGPLTNLLQPEGDPSRLFVTEKEGRILSFDPRPEVEELDVFLDIRQQVSSAGFEEGLLGMAFHPHFSENRRFYVYYSASDPRRSILSQFSVDPANTHTADPASEVVLLEVPQPFDAHNAGAITFGPDGYLYVALGDGGSFGDILGQGQNRSTLLGAILRIDVDSTSEGRAYGIPQDNPFLEDPDTLDEIWAYGFRNPWRFTFDAATGHFWVADVGDGGWEEVNIVEPGRNYGWNIMEGRECFPPGAQCDPTGLELPIHSYPLWVAGDCAIIGGVVYRGDAMPQLTGVYVFGDFCSSRVWGLRYDGVEVINHRVLVETELSITSFGVDLGGSLYLVTFDGHIYRLSEVVPENLGR
jgi:glucose/arabinose dehydrogenase